VFIRGTNTKHEEARNTASRNTKTNIFQKGIAAFKATIEINKKGHHADVSAHAKDVDLISLRQKCNYKGYKGENGRSRWMQISAGCVQACYHQ
jgi:hypothetical protein